MTHMGGSETAVQSHTLSRLHMVGYGNGLAARVNSAFGKGKKMGDI